MFFKLYVMPYQYSSRYTTFIIWIMVPGLQTENHTILAWHLEVDIHVCQSTSTLTFTAINQTDWNRNCTSVASAVNSTFSKTQMTNNHHWKVKFRFKNERIYHHTWSVLITKITCTLLMLHAWTALGCSVMQAMDTDCSTYYYTSYDLATTKQEEKKKETEVTEAKCETDPYGFPS